MKNVKLGTTGMFYDNGYVIMDFNGPEAVISYYQDTDENRADVPGENRSGTF